MSKPDQAVVATANNSSIIHAYRLCRTVYVKLVKQFNSIHLCWVSLLVFGCSAVFDVFCSKILIFVPGQLEWYVLQLLCSVVSYLSRDDLWNQSDVRQKLACIFCGPQDKTVRKRNFNFGQCTAWDHLELSPFRIDHPPQAMCIFAHLFQQELDSVSFKDIAKYCSRCHYSRHIVCECVFQYDHFYCVLCLVNYCGLIMHTNVLNSFSIQLEYANGFVVIWIVAFISSLTVIILDLS